MKKQMNALILILAAMVLTNCSPKGFQAAGVSTSTSIGGNNGGLGGGVIPPVDNVTKPIDTVNMQGMVESTQASSFNKTLTFDLDKVKGEFIIMIPFPAGFQFSPSGSFSKYPDIHFGPAMDLNGNMKLAVRIPVKYIVKGINFLPAARLPNGDALPMMPSGYGELPSLALSFPANGTELSLYIGVNAVGLFVTLPENIAIPFGFTFPVKSADKSKTYGFLSYVPPKGMYAPGMFVSTIVPPNVSRILEDYFKL